MQPLVLSLLGLVRCWKKNITVYQREAAKVVIIVLWTSSHF